MSQTSRITLLDASELKVRFNDNEVLKSASLTIRDGDHLGMVGRNGCGKSTFLKILAGIAQADDGKVTPRSGLGIGYLPQGLEASDGVSVLDTIRDGAAHHSICSTSTSRCPPTRTGRPSWSNKSPPPMRGTSRHESRRR